MGNNPGHLCQRWVLLISVKAKYTLKWQGQVQRLGEGCWHLCWRIMLPTGRCKVGGWGGVGPLSVQCGEIGAKRDPNRGFLLKASWSGFISFVFFSRFLLFPVVLLFLFSPESGEWLTWPTAGAGGCIFLEKTVNGAGKSCRAPSSSLPLPACPPWKCAWVRRGNQECPLSVELG